MRAAKERRADTDSASIVCRMPAFCFHDATFAGITPFLPRPARVPASRTFLRWGELTHSIAQRAHATLSHIAQIKSTIKKAGQLPG
jgi:hypothetical protein